MDKEELWTGIKIWVISFIGIALIFGVLAFIGAFF